MEIPHKIPIDFQRGILKVSIRNWPRDIHTTFPLILKGIPYCFNIEFGQRLSKLKFYWCRKKFLNASLWELGVSADKFLTDSERNFSRVSYGNSCRALQTNFRLILKWILWGFHMEMTKSSPSQFPVVFEKDPSRISYEISIWFWEEFCKDSTWKLI